MSTANTVTITRSRNDATETPDNNENGRLSLVPTSNSRFSAHMERLGAGSGRRSVYEGLAQIHTNLTDLRDSHFANVVALQDDEDPGENDEDDDEEKGDDGEESSTKSVIDRCYENQRGWFLFGFPFFSSSLLPFDPAGWTSDKGVAISGDPSTYLLPETSWKWVWKRWYVDMTLDVDDQGWSYSWRFGSKSWYGSHLWLQSFVRRRVWIRKRQKKEKATRHIKDEEEVPFDVRPAAEDSGSRWFTTGRDVEEVVTNIGTVSELELALNEARLDRERTRILSGFMCEEKNQHALWTIGQNSDKYLETILGSFNFDNSKYHLLKYLNRDDRLAFSESGHEEVYQWLIELIEQHLQDRGYYHHELE